MGYDKRIGHEFLQPGPGLGRLAASRRTPGRWCTSPRTPATTSTCSRASSTVNDEQFERVVDKVERPGRRLARRRARSRCGASRSRPAPTTCATRRRSRSSSGCSTAGADGPGLRPGRRRRADAGARRASRSCADPYAACEGADVLVVLTEWDEFRWLDFDKVAEPDGAPAGRRRPQPARPRRAASGAGFDVRRASAQLMAGASSSPAAPGSSARTCAERCSTAGDEVVCRRQPHHRARRQHRAPLRPARASRSSSTT